MKSFVIVLLLLAPLMYAQQAPSDAVGQAPVVTVSATTAPANTARSAPVLRLAAGDLVEVQVFDTAELSGRLRVSEKGEIQMPIAGPVEVQGLTAEQAGARITARLRDAHILNEPHVSVFVVEYATQGVSVLGEIKNPGIYPVLGAHGLLDFISVAGGVTPTAGKVVA